MLVAMLASPELAASRDRAHAREFQREQPCPSTGLRRGPCPGHVIDHIEPLCAGGADATWNMQWQTILEARRKDAQERRLCRALRGAPA